MGYGKETNTIISIVTNGYMLGRSNGTDDTAALQSACASGLPIHFKKGETYIYKSRLDLSANQVIYGNGGALKRGDAVGVIGIRMAANCRIYDLHIDGNKANQTSPLWNTHQEILTNNDCVVQNVTIKNAPAEGILVSGNRVRINNCYILDSGGNGIHFSGSSDVVVDSCSVINANLTAGVGHEDGCIIWSNLCENTTVQNCYVENGISGFGSLDSIDNSNITIANNTIKNMRNRAFDLVLPAGETIKNILITGNRVYNSKVVDIAHGATTEKVHSDIIITANIFEDTTVKLWRCKKVSFHNNIVKLSDPAAFVVAVYLVQAELCFIKDNLIEGGQYGIYLENNMQKIDITSNKLLNQTRSGIYETLRSATDVGLTIQNNNISNAVDADAVYVAIYLKPRSVAQGNYIEMVKGTYGIQHQEGKAFSIGNTIITPAGVPSVKVYAGTTYNIVKDNIVTVAPAVGTDPTNIVDGNLVTVI